MTAIVGILNKHGIAVAADSAETIGNGVKIYNKANKIFTLSKYEPVGAAVYGNATLGGLTPWDIIFKMYRRELGKVTKMTMEEYVADFISYLGKNKYFSSSNDYQKVFNQQILSYFREYIIINRIGNGKERPFTEDELKIVLENIKNEYVGLKQIESISEISQEQFGVYINESIQIISQILFERGIDIKKIKSLLLEVLYLAFTREENLHSYSGIAIFGYGNQEIYPSMYRLKIYGVLCDKLKWYMEEICRVDNNNCAIVCPMAQSDVMLTILKGIEPKLHNDIIQLMSHVLDECMKQISGKISKTDENLANEVMNIDKQPAIQFLSTSLNGIVNESHIRPLINTIATLPKEDLAEVAENLIYLTSLMRRITPDQESVGGPIDVALVSKGDGFIWIKRKLYFEKSLNETYFSKYLNND